MDTFKINKQFETQLITSILTSPIVYIPHFNYTYIDKTIENICSSGIVGLSLDDVAELYGKELVHIMTKEKIQDSESYSLSQLIKNTANEICEEATVFIIKNCFNELQNTECQLALQQFAAKYEKGELDERLTFILVSPQPLEQLPAEIEKIITPIEIPAPTDREIDEYIKESLEVSKQYQLFEKDLRVELTHTLQGLQHYEIEQIIRSAKVRTGGMLTRQTIGFALEEKKSLVKKSGIIEVVDSNISFEDVGGLENLITDLKRKKVLFQHLNDLGKARLPLPKGILVLGMPGCGKSLIAKSIAHEFGISLLRLDVNRLMGSYVGQSEANLRKALSVAEAAHPCVLWIDEIEKAFAGANGGGNNDIVMRLMGHFLTWMQERKTAVYIVATANDAMRPEFMRKGRFDEVYFVDFPTLKERKEILRKKIDSYTKSTDQQKIFDMSAVNKDDVIEDLAKQMHGGEIKDKDAKNMSNGFSGAEIQAVVEAVIEKKYIEYLGNADTAKLKNEEPKKVIITKTDFETEIKILEPSVMVNQQGMEENGVKQKTSVERIRDLQKVYKFRLATSA